MGKQQQVIVKYNLKRGNKVFKYLSIFTVLATLLSCSTKQANNVNFSITDLKKDVEQTHYNTTIKGNAIIKTTNAFASKSTLLVYLKVGFYYNNNLIDEIQTRPIVYHGTGRVDIYNAFFPDKFASIMNNANLVDIKFTIIGWQEINPGTLEQ